MGQPVKLSDQLVNEARAISPFSHRSIAGQIEFWAALGKSLEPLLRGDLAVSLQASGAERSLSSAIAQVETQQGRKRLKKYLDTRPYPHYQPVEGNPNLIRRIQENGSAAIGRFVGREFVAIEEDR